MALGGGVRVRESDGGVYSNAIGLFFSSKKGRSFAGAYAGMKWIEGFAFLMIRKDRDADLALTE